ncbi:hypothetical protein EV363DRAFT_1303139 [Boletus edulis]|nr:hypothetical protein EV363DRAFT_1303139 [Boletus edulis]
MLVLPAPVFDGGVTRRFCTSKGVPMFAGRATTTAMTYSEEGKQGGKDVVGRTDNSEGEGVRERGSGASEVGRASDSVRGQGGEGMDSKGELGRASGSLSSVRQRQWRARVMAFKGEHVREGEARRRLADDKRRRARARARGERATARMNEVGVRSRRVVGGRGWRWRGHTTAKARARANEMRRASDEARRRPQGEDDGVRGGGGGRVRWRGHGTARARASWGGQAAHRRSRGESDGVQG